MSSRSETLKILTSAFVREGLFTKSRDMLVRPLTSEIFGWMGFNARTGTGATGSVVVLPLVGVGIVSYPMIAARVFRSKKLSDPVPMFTVPLNELSPEIRPSEWYFEGGNIDEALVRHLVDVVNDYAVPYMEGLVSPRALTNEVERVGGLQSEFKLPILYLELGEYEKTDQLLQSLLTAVDGRSGSYPDFVTSFAREMRALIDERISANLSLGTSSG